MLEDGWKKIEAVVGRYPDGIGVQDISRELHAGLPRRTLQYRLARLVEMGRLVKEGKGPSTSYRLTRSLDVGVQAEAGSRERQVGAEVVPDDLKRLRDELRQRYLSRPADQREAVSYRREFLGNYRPNVSAYLSTEERTRLRGMGELVQVPEPAGTYARRILDRMLIDLSWNSSRLEGNTYSLLDTKRLIELGDPAEGRDIRETQMIVNHKHAIEFLVENANEVGFDRRTVLNLHAILAENLLPDPAGPGRLRRMPVGIGASAYRPLEVPAQLEECFNDVLATTQAIDDPFEQAMFCLVQIPLSPGLRRRQQASLPPRGEHTVHQEQPLAALVQRRTSRLLHGRCSVGIRTERNQLDEEPVPLGLRTFRRTVWRDQTNDRRTGPVQASTPRGIARSRRRGGPQSFGR